MFSTDPILNAVLALVILVLFVALPIILLARVSHWAFHTQRKLEQTNTLLASVLAELRASRRE